MMLLTTKGTTWQSGGRSKTGYRRASCCMDTQMLRNTVLAKDSRKGTLSTSLIIASANTRAGAK